jgi:hypothetical protein
MLKTIIVVLIILFICSLCVDSRVTVGVQEGMAPLNYGTYINKYPRGRCDRTRVKNSTCSIGNCPIGTTITNDRYCKIQCAQDPDPAIRDECYDECMDMMNGGCA